MNPSWLAELIDLTIRGALVAAAVLTLDLALGRWLAGRDRRLLWLLVPAAFLVPLRCDLPFLPAHGIPPFFSAIDLAWDRPLPAPHGASVAGPAPHPWLLPAIWLLGVGIGIFIVAARRACARRSA